MYDFGENIFMNNEKYLDELDGRLQVLNELRKRIIELSKAIIGDEMVRGRAEAAEAKEREFAEEEALLKAMQRGELPQGDE